MTIREASDSDQDAIEKIYRLAFPAEEADSVASLATALLATAAPTFALVTEMNGDVMAHVAFSPVVLEDGSDLAGFILAPLAVAPDFQKNGAGSKLVEAGLERLSGDGADFVLVYGDPDYYGRFGFEADAATAFQAPYPLAYPFGWQCRLLGDRVIGQHPSVITCVPALSRPELW